MENFESQPNKEESSTIDKDKLVRLMHEDDQTMELTVGRMAMEDIEKGELKSAVKRLLVDADKIRPVNRELYDYLRKVRERMKEADEWR